MLTAFIFVVLALISSTIANPVAVTHTVTYGLCFTEVPGSVVTATVAGATVTANVGGTKIVTQTVNAFGKRAPAPQTTIFNTDICSETVTIAGVATQTVVDPKLTTTVQQFAATKTVTFTNIHA